MERTGLSNRRLTNRENRIGRVIRIVSRDESVGAVYVRRIQDVFIGQSLCPETSSSSGHG